MAGETPGATGTAPAATSAPAATPPAASGTSPGGTPPASGAAGSPPASGAQGDTWAGFQEPDQRYIGNKGWKSPTDMYTSYRHLEAVLGKVTGANPDTVVVLPKDDPEGKYRREALTKLGAPEKPEGYGFKVPEKGDPTIAKWAAETFHKHGIPAQEAQALVK